MPPGFEVSKEATRLLSLPPLRARAEFGDRVARTFLLDSPTQLSEFWQALSFNAHLATEVRLQCAQGRRETFWEEGR